MSRSADSLVDEARRAIERVTVREAHALHGQGALLVDIRPEKQRLEHGEVPGALIIERNVLEWRLDPNGDHHIPEVTTYDRPVLILCQQGYASSLAAASVAALGYTRAADVIGGFEAWVEAGLPSTRRP